MKLQTKLKLRSEKGSVQGEVLSGMNPDSSFSNDERGSLDRSMSVQGLPLESSSGMPLSSNQPVLQPLFMMSPVHFGYSQPFLMPCQYGVPGMRPFPFQPVSLMQFKTVECSVKSNHDHKQCPYYHSMKDRRRAQTNKYEPELCSFTLAEKVCPKYENCTYSHNTVEQFYHPKKYKTKLCSSVGATKEAESKCIYGNFCSFAHEIQELKIPKLHLMEKTPEFFKYLYKTIYCPFNQNHDKSSCEYAHNVQDFRRDPRTTNYKAEACKKWSPSTEICKYEDGGCNYNEACDKCHGWKELEYHPKYYKMKPCTNGDKCARVDCGYLHPNEKMKKDGESKLDSKHNQSLKESQTSTSNKARGKLTESVHSQQSSSKNENLLTFKSSSNSKPAKNDSVLGRNDEEDKIDLRSIMNAEEKHRPHAYSMLGNYEDEDSVDGKLYLTQTTLLLEIRGSVLLKL